MSPAKVEVGWNVDSCWVLAVSATLVEMEAGVEAAVAELAALSPLGL